MDADRIELARQAVALLRAALTGHADLIMASENVELRAASGLAVHLLNRCVEPADLERELIAIDKVLVDKLTEQLTRDIDWDGLLNPPT